MTALFELTNEYRALADKLNDLELDQQTINDTLDGASGDLEEKIINTAKYYRNIDADAEKIEEAAKQMLGRAKTLPRAPPTSNSTGELIWNAQGCKR